MLSKRALLRMAAAAAAIPPSLALEAGGHDPVEIIDLVTAGGRIAKVTHWRARSPRGTILFSHGALSSPAKYDPFIRPWVAAGYDVWAPLHVDSTDHPDTKAFTGFMSWRARIEDMRALSHHIGDRPRIAAGHSYGGLIALTLGGAAADVPEGLTGPLNDPLVKAVVAFSPPPPIKGLISREGYATLAVPALIQTGTRDIMGPATDPEAWRAHLIAYEAAAPGHDRYALVLDGANHYFGGMICSFDQPGPPQTAQLAVAGEVSRLFIAGFGQDDRQARKALDTRITDTGPAKLSRK